MRWMLAVDTCGTAEGSVALLDLQAREVRIAATRVLPGRETQERLMPAIREVLEEAALAPGDLHALAVVTGPGSFTGVRIGLATVKGLAEALGLPVVALSRLAVLAAQVPGPAEAWIDAGRGDVFRGRYVHGVCRDEAMLTGAAALEQVDGDVPVVAMETAVAERFAGTTLVQPVSIRAAAPLLAGQVRASEFADIALLDANYLRVPDAELARQRADAAAR